MRTGFLIPVFAALVLPFRCAFASSAGNTTGQILKLGGGAGHAAVGDAATAFSGDATAMFWNPAGLGFLNRCSVTAGRSLLFESVNYSVGAAACPAGRLGSFGLGWQLLDYGKITARDNAGTVDGDFSPSDTVFSASWGGALTRNIALGVTGKRVLVKIENHGMVYAADAGILARFSSFSAGVAVRNIARKIKINETPEKLPRTIKIGARAELYDMTFIMDANSSKDASWLSGGAEYAFFQEGAAFPVMFRAGYSTRLRTGGYNYTAGVGMREKFWSMDYALVPYGDFGLTHHFSITFAFGKSAPGSAQAVPARAEFRLDQSGPPSDQLIFLPSEIPAKNKKP
jgi:hypothetical protein